MRLRWILDGTLRKSAICPIYGSKLPHRDIVPSVFQVFRFFRATRIATGANGGRNEEEKSNRFHCDSGQYVVWQFPGLKIAESRSSLSPTQGRSCWGKVVIPEFVVVHDGPPSDPNAANYYVRYRDYIKNVASSEIYSTWPDSAARANILAIMSFTLNRVYTEWYRNKGYNFTITTSTAYDQKFVYGRNIFQSISDVVEEMFRIIFPDRMWDSQSWRSIVTDSAWRAATGWASGESKYLGDQNYETIEILRYYYGDNMFINTAEEISGIPSSWPRYNLEVGGAEIRSGRSRNS